MYLCYTRTKRKRLSKTYDNLEVVAVANVFVVVVCLYYIGLTILDSQSNVPNTRKFVLVCCSFLSDYQTDTVLEHKHVNTVTCVAKGKTNL